MDDGNAATGKVIGMGRRALLLRGLGAGLTLSALGLPALARAGGSGIPADGKLAFQVWRQGNHIGEHALTFTQDGDDLTVQIDVHIVVKIGPVPVARYTHNCREHWSAGQFQSLDAVSHSLPGHQQHTTAKRTADGIYIEPAGGASPYTTTADTLPMSHWNRQDMRAPLFNPQDGKILKETSRIPKGEEMIKLADGTMIKATRYAITGDAAVDDWYDANNVWTALHGRVVDGSYIDYLRL
jgi:hypothetical protein